MDHGDPRLLHRGGGESREADHVARRVDVRHRRLIALVDRQQAALVDGDAGALEREPRDVGHAPGRYQHRLRLERVAALEVEPDAVGVCVVADHRLAQPDVAAEQLHLQPRTRSIWWRSMLAFTTSRSERTTSCSRYMKSCTVRSGLTE